MNGQSDGAVLLTGATGFVGRNLLLRLLAEGRSVIVPVRNEAKLHAQLAAESVPADTLHVLPPDPAAWPPIAPKRAILCAGVLFARNRAEYFATNVDWTLRVARVLPESCRTIVVSSQSAGGPTPRGVDARRKSDPDAPITWYGESKLAMEAALADQLPGRSITILRPPMILGARDTATLPLFQMARGVLRIKPGWRPRQYSFLAVDDLVAAIECALEASLPRGPYYVAHPDAITDRDLIDAAAAACGVRGVTVAMPGMFVQALSRVVDAVPELRARVPSLTRDRVRELAPLRWVMDGAAFSRQTGWTARVGFRAALQSAHDHYVRAGLLPTR